VLAAITCIASPAAAKPSPSPSPSPAAAKKGAAKAACLAAHEDALALRSQQKPHAAREKLVACARAECPTLVRKECADQLAVVEKDAPTVALEARDEGGMDTTAVKVTMDGQPLAERLTGSAVDVEPGEHVFRFERADGKSLEQHVLVVEGDKNRKVTADFGSLVPKPPPGEGSPIGPPESRKIPTVAYVAGGVSLVALGSFVFFALSGKGSEKDLASSCGPSCSDDQLSPVKRDYLIADISLVIGLAAAVSAGVLAWPALSGPSPQTAASIGRQSAPMPWLPRVKVRTQP
jgi:hypothetical protein